MPKNICEILDSCVVRRSYAVVSLMYSCHLRLARPDLLRTLFGRVSNFGDSQQDNDELSKLPN